MITKNSTHWTTNWNLLEEMLIAMEAAKYSQMCQSRSEPEGKPAEQHTVWNCTELLQNLTPLLIFYLSSFSFLSCIQQESHMCKSLFISSLKLHREPCTHTRDCNKVERETGREHPAQLIPSAESTWWTTVINELQANSESWNYISNQS